MSKLKELREAAGLSMTELARRAGTNQPQVWRFEHGAHPNGLKTALALAAALRCRVTDIWPDAAPQRLTYNRPRRTAVRGTERHPQAPKNRGKTKR